MKTMLSQSKIKFAFNHESARLTSLVAANKGNHVYVCDDWQPSYNPRHLPAKLGHSLYANWYDNSDGFWNDDDKPHIRGASY